MLDKHYHSKMVTREVTKQVNIKEFRAPTDESLRLLSEMEQKVKERFISSIEVVDNFLTTEVLFFEEPFNRRHEITFCVKFNINGHDYSGEGKMDRMEMMKLQNLSGDSSVIRKEVRKMISSIIMEALDGDINNQLNGK